MAEEAVSGEENYENDLIDSGLVGVLDMLNLKIVPKETSDPSFSRFNEVIPSESRQYAAEYVRLQDQNEKLTKELAAITSTSGSQVQEELAETKKALERERNVGAEARQALAAVQRKAKEATNSFLEEKEKLKQVVSTSEKKLEVAQLKIVEQERKMEESYLANEDLRKQNDEMGKVSKLGRENLSKIQKEKTIIEEDLRKSKAANSQLEEELNKIGTSSFEVQSKLDALQGRFSEMEDKLKEKITKCGEYYNEKKKLEENLRKSTSTNSQLEEKLEETTTKLNSVESQLMASEKTVTELRKVADEVSVSDLQRKLREKTNEVEDFRRDLNTKREEKSKIQDELNSCLESLNNFNSELDQLIEQLKNSIGFDDEGVDPSQPNTLQSRLEWISVHIQSIIKSREVTVKELQAELANSRETIRAKNEQLQKQSDEANRITVPPLPPPPSNSDLPHPQFSDRECDNIAISVARSPMPEATTTTSTADLTPDAVASLEETQGIIVTGFGDSDIGSKAIPKDMSNYIGALWKPMAPPPVPSEINEGDVQIENRSESTSMDERMQPPTPEPIDQEIQNDDQSPSSSGRNGEAESPQHQSLLSAEVSKSSILGTASVVQDQQHGTDETKSGIGNFCLCGKKFNSKQSLKDHIRYYILEPKFPCTICRLYFKKESTLKSHYLRHRKKAIKQKRRSRSSTLAISKPKPTSESVGPPSPPALPNSSSQQHELDISNIKVEVDHNTTRVEVEHGIDHSKKARRGFYCKCGRFRSSGRYAKYNLQKHIKYANGKRHFGCPRCPLSFKATSHLRKHTLSSHNLEYKLIGCQDCGNLFENIGALREHKRSQHKKVRQRIKEIDLTNVPTPAPHRTEEYLDEFQLVEEVTTHASQMTTQQETLPTPSSNVGMLATTLSSSQKSISLPTLQKKKHSRDMSKRKLGFFCVCGTNKRNEAAFNGHITYFSSGKKFECEVCGHRTLYLDQLKRHLKSEHKLVDSSQLRQMGMGCSLCGEYGFTTRKDLYTHEKAAHPTLNDSAASSTGNKTESLKPQPSTSKRLPTSINDRLSFKSRCPRTKARRTLSSPKSSPTPASSSNLSKTGALHAIDQTKLTQGLFFCICGSSFSCRQYLGSHISYMTSGNRFACPICKKKFSFMSILRKHTKRSHKHHNPDLSGCFTCFKVFPSQRELVEHNMSTHKQSSKPKEQVPLRPILNTLTSIVPAAVTTTEQVESASFDGLGAFNLSSNSSSSPVEPFPSSSHVEQSITPSHEDSSATASKNRDENDDDDVIIDAHLTYEPGFVIPKVHETTSSGHYSSPGKWICKTCDKDFLLAKYFSHHMLRKHGIKYKIPYKCRLCSKMFPTDQQLYEHYEMEHENGGNLEQKYQPPTTSQLISPSEDTTQPGENY